MRIRLGNFDFERFSPANLYNTYLGMTGREQTYALIGAAAAVVIIILLPVSMAAAKLSSLKSEAMEGRQQITTIMTEVENYNKVQSEYEGLKKLLISSTDVSLPSILESLAEKQGIKDQIDSLKNLTGTAAGNMEQMSVDVRLRRVALSALINYLYEIENYSGAKLKLTQLEVRPRYDNVKELNVSFIVSTYQMPNETGGN